MTALQSFFKFKIQKIKNLLHLVEGYYWAWKCGWPGKKLYVIGVTGTDGKTTTCTLIYEILKAAGFKVDYVTTVNSEGLHTTNPSPKQLQPLLKKMVDRGITHVVLEVTSHGLDQNRVVGIDFQIGVLTNLTHEHLDYHGNMRNYREAKAKLISNVQYSVINKDDKSFEYFKNVSRGTVIPYEKSKLKNINESLAGDYNKYNISAATAVAQILNVQNSISNEVVKTFTGVEGRRQEVKNKKGIGVYVDFAHTPNALEQILSQLRKETKQKLIVVFGCTGERDKEKRPMMGEIAARLADIVIITSDDTRSESQDEIAAQIMGGISKVQSAKCKVLKINDRREAIEHAISLAKKGDTILLAGKGHEKSILIGSVEKPWSDVAIAGKILR